MITSDNPIQCLEDDTLGRAAFAQSFTQQILSLDATQGIVVGVLGAWGSGKTSFVNLARNEFEQIGVPILDFNPWMFSGAEQLIISFFVELSAQLKIRKGLDDIGKDLEKYGETFSGIVWIPLVGPWIERLSSASKILGKLFKRRKKGIGDKRKTIEKSLRKLDKPIVVVLDDIDRLSSSEIRDVFKLVRLTASFPNIIYIVAFDRVRVERALEELGVPGRDYLEKILQVAADLPAIPSHILDQLIISAVDGALSNIEKTGHFDKQVWPDVFMEIIRPLIRNMRDVRRYAAAVYGTVYALKGQIALVDVLALEAIRLFLPDVFGQLHDSIEGLTQTSDISFRASGDPPQFKEQIDGLIKAAGKYGPVVNALIERLFPAGIKYISGTHYGGDWKNSWFKERRIAHEDILKLYLERIEGESLQAFTAAEQAWNLMSDKPALDKYLRSLDLNHLEDVIASLENYEEQFASEHVIPGTIVILNLLPDLPRKQKGFLGLDTHFVVTRVAYRLVRSLKDLAAVEAAVRQILPELKYLFLKLELIRIIGYWEHVGHKLVSEAAASEFEKAWRDAVRSASVEDLIKEHNLIWILHLVKEKADASEGPINISDSPQMTLAVLISAQSEATSQSIGSRAIRRSLRLAWDDLIEIYGSEEILRERIKSLKTTKPKGVEELIELADKYISGWRPKNFEDQ
ncbi:MAG: KAP family NTPase [Thermodesulfovibrionales bacterium]|nr:KAP family NTPase [Thermodesulfovibrionales bacterium]